MFKCVMFGVLDFVPVYSFQTVDYYDYSVLYILQFGGITT